MAFGINLDVGKKSVMAYILLKNNCLIIKKLLKKLENFFVTFLRPY